MAPFEFRSEKLKQLKGVLEIECQTLFVLEPPHDPTNLINAYNNIIEYSERDYDQRKSKTKQFIKDTIIAARILIHDCSYKLKLNVHTPYTNLFERARLSEPKPPKPDPIPEPPQPDPFVNPEPKPQPIKMATFDYAKEVKSILTGIYSGEPEGLSTFIDSIELAAEMSTTEQIPALIRIIRTKCDKKAKQVIDEISPAPTTIKQIVDALRANIQVETVPVILGRFMALKADRTSTQQFQEKGEKLAEQLRLAYISRGIPPTVAKEMVVTSAREMCMSNARNDYVESVLESTPFSTPEEVFAKYAVVVGKRKEKAKTEASVLKFSDNRNRGRGNNRGNNRGYHRGGRSYNNNYGNYNNQGNNNGQFRGRGRGRFNRYNGNNGRFTRNHGNYDRNMYVMQENQGAPTQERGNASNSTANQMTIRQVRD